MILLLAIPRYIWRNLWTLWLGGLIFGLLLIMPLPARLTLVRDTWIGGQKASLGLPGYSEPPGHLEKLWLHVRYRDLFEANEIPDLFNLTDVQWQVNLMYLTRIQKLEARLGYLEGNVTLLKNDIPPLMVVDIVDGEQVIRPEFWTALRGKMAGDTQLWDSFVRANEETLTIAMDQAADTRLNTAIGDQRVLDRASFQGLMDESTRQLVYQFQKDFHEAKESMQYEIRETVSSAISELSERSPMNAKDKIMLMKRAMVVQNLYNSYASVNHLSLPAGARVDAQHTSPSLKLRQEQDFFGYRYYTNVIHSPPVMALLKWDELGECWCAAHSEEHGKAQLAINLNHYVYPNQVYIEHIPAQAALGIAAAPQDFEVWADAADAEQAEFFRAKIAEYYQEYPQKPYGCMDSSPPTDTAVCIAQGSYNIHLDNWVQQWSTIIDTKEIGFVTRKVYFRFTSNWGAEHTCIYRVRLGAHEIEESDPYY